MKKSSSKIPRKPVKLPAVTRTAKRSQARLRTIRVTQRRHRTLGHAASTAKLSKTFLTPQPKTKRRVHIPHHGSLGSLHKRRILNISASDATLPSIHHKSPPKRHDHYTHFHPHSSVHEILPEFGDVDESGVLTSSIVDEWLSTSKQQSDTNSHSKFQSMINFTKLKFAEIDRLTYHHTKLHPARVRVFASLLKLFLESICQLNPSYSFAKILLKDLYRSLFVHTTVNNVELDLSTFKAAEIYSEQLTQLEDLVLDPKVHPERIRKYILKNRAERDAEIVTTADSEATLSMSGMAPRGHSKVTSPMARKHGIGLRRRASVAACSVLSFRSQLTEDRTVTFMDDLKSQLESAEDTESSSSIDSESAYDATSKSKSKMAALFIQKTDSSLESMCFSAWHKYVARRVSYRRAVVCKYRAVQSKRWFLRWKEYVRKCVLNKTCQKLSNTRLELVKVQSELDHKEKDYERTIGHLKEQLNFILNKEDSDSSTADSVKRARSEKNKGWNRTIALHAMHLLEYKKGQFEALLVDKEAIDPCSIRFHPDRPLPVSRQEYYSELQALSTEEMVLLWTNTKLSHWMDTHRHTKAFKRMSSLIGDPSTVKVTNFSKDWTDGRIYVILFHSIWPDTFSLSALQDLPAQRLHTVTDFAKSMGFNTGPFVTPRDILNECSDLNLAFLGTTMIEAPKPSPSASNFAVESKYVLAKYDRCTKLFRSARVRQHERMKAFLDEMLETVAVIDCYLADLVKGSYVWNEMVSGITLKVATVLAYRYRNKQPMHPKDPVETAILGRMCVLPRGGIEQYLCATAPDADYQALCALLEQYAEDLREIFDIYCNYASGNTHLSVLSWMVFARNLKITDKHFNNLRLRQLIKRLLSPDTARMNQLKASGITFDHSEAMLDRELFSKSIVQIAAEKWPKNTSSGLTRITDKVAVLLDRHLKMAKKGDDLPNTQSPFTAGGIEAIFKDHGMQLKQIYAFYTRADDTKGAEQKGTTTKKAPKSKKNSPKKEKLQSDGTPDALQTEAAAAAAGGGPMALLDRPLKIAQFRSLVKHAGLAETAYSNQISFLDSLVDQITRIMNNHIAPGASEIVYEEFLELLAIMCILRNPDPYQPLDKKLGAFLERNIIKPIYGSVMSKKN